MQFDFLNSLSFWTRRGSSAKPAAPASRADDAVLIARARELLVSLGEHALAGRVRVQWNPRMRTTAGLAHYKPSLITLNPKLSQFGHAEIDRTLRHELAHLLAHARAGRRHIAPHGAEWKQACRDLGLPNEKRCHELPLPRAKMKTRHVYRCPVCKVDIHRVRPFGRRVACLACCRAHNRGGYDERFRLKKIPMA